LFEPQAPSIKSRINALDELHRAGIRTFAMIAPLLPKADGLVNELEGKVDYLLIDRLNYHYSDWVYKNNDLENAMSDSFFSQKTIELAAVFKIKQIECRVLC
jgi:DNA repair photolyase